MATAKRKSSGKAIRCPSGKAGTSCCVVGNVIPGILCGCNDPAHPFTPVIPDPGPGPFQIVAKVDEKCYRFPLSGARPFQSGDQLFPSPEEFDTCQDCCDTIPMHPPCCDPPDERSCYQQAGAVATVSGSVTHFNRAECAAGALQAEATESIPLPSSMPFTAQPEPCDPTGAESIQTEIVTYTYNQACNPAFPVQDTYILEHGVGVTYTNDDQFGNPEDATWDVSMSFAGADVSATLEPTIKIVDGVIVTDPPEISIWHTRLGPSSISFFRGNHPITFTATITGPCEFTLRFQWDVQDSLEPPDEQSRDEWSSTGDVTIVVSGWVHCGDDPPPIGARSGGGCGSCGSDSRMGAI